MHLNSVFFLKTFLRHNLQNKLQRSTAQLTYTHEIVTTINIINIFITFKLFCVIFINPCFVPHQSHFLTQPFMYFLLLQNLTEVYGQRSLVGCSPWGHKKLGMTQQLTTKNSTANMLFTLLHNILRFVNIIMCIECSLCYIAKQYSIVHIKLFPVDGLLDYFQFVGNTHKTAINICIHIFVLKAT